MNFVILSIYLPIPLNLLILIMFEIYKQHEAERSKEKIRILSYIKSFDESYLDELSISMLVEKKKILNAIKQGNASSLNLKKFGEESLIKSSDELCKKIQIIDDNKKEEISLLEEVFVLSFFYNSLVIITFFAADNLSFYFK